MNQVSNCSRATQQVNTNSISFSSSFKQVSLKMTNNNHHYSNDIYNDAGNINPKKSFKEKCATKSTSSDDLNNTETPATEPPRYHSSFSIDALVGDMSPKQKQEQDNGSINGDNGAVDLIWNHQMEEIKRIQQIYYQKFYNERFSLKNLNELSSSSYPSYLSGSNHLNNDNCDVSRYLVEQQQQQQQQQLQQEHFLAYYTNLFLQQHSSYHDLYFDSLKNYYSTTTPSNDNARDVMNFTSSNKTKHTNRSNDESLHSSNDKSSTRINIENSNKHGTSESNKNSSQSKTKNRYESMNLSGASLSSPNLALSVSPTNSQTKNNKLLNNNLFNNDDNTAVTDLINDQSTASLRSNHVTNMKLNNNNNNDDDHHHTINGLNYYSSSYCDYDSLKAKTTSHTHNHLLSNNDNKCQRLIHSPSLSSSSLLASNGSPQDAAAAAAAFHFSNMFRKPKRIRTAFSPGQLLRLEEIFEKNRYVVGCERKQLARDLNLSETQIKVWFQNRRTKHKREKHINGSGENHHHLSNSHHMLSFRHGHHPLDDLTKKLYSSSSSSRLSSMDSTRCSPTSSATSYANLSSLVSSSSSSSSSTSTSTSSHHHHNHVTNDAFNFKNSTHSRTLLAK